MREPRTVGILWEWTRKKKKEQYLGMGAWQDSNCEGFNIQVDRVPELLEAPVNLYFASF